jgi:GNAT superfamily N-acetyltransferase
MGIAEHAGERGGPIFVRREARAEPIDASLKAAVADPDQLVLAGTYEDAVVGYAAARVDPLHDGARLAVLTELFVEPEAREVGIGDALMAAVLAWASEHGCVGVDSIALPGDRETKNFFESNGLVARAIIVHKALP